MTVNSRTVRKESKTSKEGSFHQVCFTSFKKITFYEAYFLQLGQNLGKDILYPCSRKKNWKDYQLNLDWKRQKSEATLV